jgi:hypothetical protein
MTTTSCSSAFPAAIVSETHNVDAVAKNNSRLCALPDPLIASIVMSLDPTSQLHLIGTCKAMSKYVMDINALEAGKQLTCYISNNTDWQGLAQVTLLLGVTVIIIRCLYAVRVLRNTATR